MGVGRTTPSSVMRPHCQRRRQFERGWKEEGTHLFWHVVEGVEDGVEEGEDELGREGREESLGVGSEIRGDESALS